MFGDNDIDQCMLNILDIIKPLKPYNTMAFIPNFPTKIKAWKKIHADTGTQCTNKKGYTNLNIMHPFF